MDLISNHFYVTESMGQRHKLSYFWKPVWQRIQAAGIRKMTEDGKIMQISEEQANIVNNNMEPKFRLGRLRLIPKENGVRPIVNIKFDNKELALKVNYLLQQFVRIEVKGGVATASEQLHKLYRHVIDGQKQGAKLYFVRTDISDAYGSINHLMLRKILNDLCAKYIGGTLLTLLELPLDSEPNKSKKMTLSERSQDSESKKRKKVVYYYANNKMKSGYEHYIQNKSDKKTIFNGFGKGENLNGLEMINYVNNMTCNMIIELGGKLRFALMQGIPQGGMWSSALCDLYYHAMDNKYLASFKNHGVLIRTVDDYLFITSNREQAVSFRERMEEGFPDFSCYVNKAKTQTNLDIQTHSVTFCGTCFDTDSFEVSGDYATYKDQDMRYAIKLNTESGRSKRGGKRLHEHETFLAARLRLFGALRLRSELFDETYNSKARVLMNFYHACLFLAFRAHAIVQQVYTTPLNEKFVMKNIGWACTRVAKYVCNLVLKNNAGSDITFDTLLWIALRAFHWKLVRSSSRYSYCIRGTRMVMEKTANRLNPAELRYLKNKTETVPQIFLTMS